MSNEQLTTNNEEILTEKQAENNNKLSAKNLEQQINLKVEKDLIIVSIPPENKNDANEWNHLIDQFQSRLHSMEKEWPPETKVKLLLQQRLLNSRQLQTIVNIFEELKLTLNLVVTSRRQTAVLAASSGYSVQQESEVKPLIKPKKKKKQSSASPLYLKNTVRSGVEIVHAGTVIVLGDINPGGTIVAGGDVFVWGSLKGIAHAGANGNRKALIMALKMDPTQLRIAELVARSPDNLPEDFDPEVAYISDQGIRITSAFNFSKTNFFSNEVDSWTDLKNQG